MSRETPITSGTIDRWWRPSSLLVVTLLALGGTEALTQYRLQQLEKRATATEDRVTRAEGANVNLGHKLDEIRAQIGDLRSDLNHRLDLVVICTRDPANCDAQLRLLGSIH